MAADLLIEVVYILILPLYGIGGIPHERTDNTDCKSRIFKRFIGAKRGYLGEVVNQKIPSYSWSKTVGMLSRHSLIPASVYHIPMVKFWHVVRLVFLERMSYRANLFLEVLGGILGSVIVVVLWKAIFQGSGTDQVGGYSLPEMVTYLIGAGIINSFILTTAEHPEASEAIQGGDLSGS
jgi:hypothetical protein